MKQRIKCFECGKNTIQQSPETYQRSFYCQRCDLMWSVIKERTIYEEMNKIDLQTAIHLIESEIEIFDMDKNDPKYGEKTRLLKKTLY